MKTFLLVAFFVTVAGIIVKMAGLLKANPPRDLARPRGDSSYGVLYAYTLGMAPWAKESTRKHAISYLRGVIFHLGIFASFVTLILSVFEVEFAGLVRDILVVLTGAGLLAGIVGIFERLTKSEMQKLNTPDDYLSVLLVTLFIAGAFGYVLNFQGQNWFYFVTGLMFFYLPFSKITHFIYFFFSRYFFGFEFGKRGVIKH
ncbi:MULTISPECIES: hypothetical protein [Carboxydothermus]|uniref:Uncharacterized protein n=2 Tax=Carboxydothermus TaxID=129957 RepID=A0ABX2RDC2_9THEO|nr:MULTISPECIES: hypothetical protein [Carboxydothermus]ABB14470.1 putative membrane protein [Carboxydothermus hydrogenoformans Z-2901]NYE57865.1 hypothetical protein [Carboxydothermus ferrireducens DSM 11255]